MQTNYRNAEHLSQVENFVRKTPCIDTTTNLNIFIAESNIS